MFIRPRSFSIPAFLILGLILGTNGSGFAQDKPAKQLSSIEGIHEYELANGLKILLFPDNSQPKVTVNNTIFVGSRHEGYGEAGMAHLLEHMLFKGTELHPNIPELLRDRGASYNGTTWLDRTNYYETLSASNENLEFAIRLEADRMVNSKILNEELQKEFTVVRSELEKGENVPFRVLLQRMFSASYQWHNYGNSTIGNRSDIERVPIESLRAFYRKHYRPDNAMLVVAGNFEELKALQMIQKYFGVIEKPRTPLSQTYTIEPAQDGDRVTTVRRVADTQMVGAMYHIPAGSDPDFPAVDVLGTILTDQSSGRLYKSLIETKKTTTVLGDAFGLHDPGVLFFMTQLPKDKSLEDAQKTMIETLENLASNPITGEEVERAKRQILNDRESRAAKSDTFAISLSEWAAQGDWRLYFLYRDAIEQVTPEQVQIVAQKYLVQNNRTIGLFVPTDKSERIRIPDRPDISEQIANYKGRESVGEGEQFDPTPRNIESRLVRGELKTGIPYAFLPKKTRGSTVSISMVLRFGDVKSLNGKAAACDILGSLMERGTKTLNLQQLSDRKDELKAKIGLTSSSTTQSLRITLETKREMLMEALSLVEDMLRHPALDELEFNLLKDKVLTQLEDQKRDPSALANIAVDRALGSYKRGDIRYTPTVEEEIEDFGKLKLSDVKDLHSKFLSGTEGEVAVVGDFEPKELEAKLSQMLENWKSKVPYQRATIPATTDVKIPMISIETPDKENSNYVASQQYALRDDHPKYPALMIGNTILGGSTVASRLGNRVRQEEGLSYGISSGLSAHPIDERAALTISAITNPVNRNKLVKVIDEELHKIVKDGVTEKELRDNIQGYLEKQKLARTQDMSLATLLANNLFTGRDMSYYEKLESAVANLTVQAVNEAISEFVSPDRFVIATAGDFATPTPVPEK